MDEQFDLPVQYKGDQLIFKSTLNVYGYTHKFNVEVNGQTIVFEPDEERNYRAVINPIDLESNKNIDIELLKKIAEALWEVVN